MPDLDPAAVTERLIATIDASPTPFHAVVESRRQLEAAGYTELREVDRWSLTAGGRHFVIRNGSTLVAFELGSEDPAEAGYRLVGAHTDSPNLRLKPNPSLKKDGYRQLGVEPYGGALLATWLDRDLSLAGRVVVAGEDEPRLLRIDRPLCRVANVAIHLNREVNKKGLILNKQKHLAPLFGLAGEGTAERWFEAFLADELGLAGPEAILGFDLMLFDVVPCTVSGADGEFVHAPRLDNLGSCHAALEALVGAGEAGPAKVTRGIALYDNEEVGSRSAEGADSPFLASVLERISLALGGTAEDRHRAVARSLFVSADMAHAVHPNYADLHEPDHMPKLNAGPVLKVNQNLRYATLGTTGGAFARYAREADVPLQTFLNRSDLACGSTIGPITAARLGMPTVDVGNPMLSMHSVREMCGSQDQAMMVKVLQRHFAD
jgi:aspartyl aminopeptidase